ncbi:toll/interleukin-1 receptor domain-containing protein [Streptomyces huasconensis]|uniref:toll/interleukin-1 receptor domain-containing protein n=1 Tax=Streptomyces huasconensis TaxID=1854574 RepID=UPI0033DE0A89
MHKIFVNYRRDDAEFTATLVERELSRAFGDDKVFRASKSIRPGSKFPQEILTAVRRCNVLLAVIGPRWLLAQSATGGRALEDPEDWIRREIIEAFEAGAVVIPLLAGQVDRLQRSELPFELRELADCQYRRLSHRNADRDLTHLIDELLRLVPELDTSGTGGPGALAERGRCDVESDASMERRAKVDNAQQRGGIGNVNGQFTGTFINESQGPVHTGSGHMFQMREQYLAPRISGDGMQVGYVGDNHGTVNQEREREQNDARSSEGER